MKQATGPIREARERFHPIVRAAGEKGQLPSWVHVDSRRRGHLERVADLMGKWAEERSSSPEVTLRWKAAGLLHDGLKGLDPDELRIWAKRNWPEPLLHGPAIAARLRGEGVRDDELLQALTYHSVGHPSFGYLGKFLYLADFLDPGRSFRGVSRERLRSRLPAECDSVIAEVTAVRLGHLIKARRTIIPASLEFWNRLVGQEEETG